MHELAIAVSIVDAAAAARRDAARVLAVHVKLGALSGVDADALRSAFALARDHVPGLACAELAIEAVPVTARCPVCGVDREVPFPGLRCPECGSPTAEVVRGRELEVTAIEVEP